jgi:hypothetical protein
MFGRKNSTSAAEVVTRSAQAMSRTVAGDKGGEAANKITEVLGLGRSDICSDSQCPHCH